jgi:hypothetical protein
MKIAAGFVAAVLFLNMAAPAYAHPGGTDAQGGHYCRTTCEEYGLRTGEYHFHDKDGNAVETYENNTKIFDKVLAKRLQGKILLQVEDHGEAYYIRSNDLKRYYMKDGQAAYDMMRYFSLGVTDTDLAKVPSVADTTEMKASVSACTSNSFANKLKGEILLQVQQHGEAWYVDPDKCRKIYLKDGAEAYEVMRFLGLGIVNTNLKKIPVGAMEQK